MEKLLNPKKLALICIIVSIIGIVLTIVNQITTYTIVKNMVQILPTMLAYFVRLIILGSLYRVIYLWIVTKKKEKNMSVLNLILFINYIIAFIFWCIYFFIPDADSTPIFECIITLILVVIIGGIYFKKKMPYKELSLAVIIVALIDFIVTIVHLIPWLTKGFSILIRLPALFTIIIQICTLLALSSFVLFLYLYGRSITNGK